MKREREIILIKPSPRISTPPYPLTRKIQSTPAISAMYILLHFFLSFPSLYVSVYRLSPPLSLFALKIFSQIEKLKFSSESSTTNLRGCSATGITNCASRMFDFPSSRPHFRMEMEARSIELALEEGLEPVRNRRWGRFNDLHLEIVAGTHTQRVIYTQP